MFLVVKRAVGHSIAGIDSNLRVNRAENRSPSLTPVVRAVASRDASRGNQDRGCLGRLTDIPLVTSDRPARRRHPEQQHVRAGVVASLAGERGGDVGHDLRLGPRYRPDALRGPSLARPATRWRKVRRACRRADATSRSACAARPANWSAASWARSSASVIPARRRAAVGANDGPLRHAFASVIRWSARFPAVDRGDIRRIERAKIAGVAPIVEMPAKPREAGHGGQRHLQSSGRFRGSQGHAKSRAAATERRYSPRLVGDVRVGQRRDWVLLEIVRRQAWSAAVTKVSKHTASRPPCDCPQRPTIGGRYGHSSEGQGEVDWIQRRKLRVTRPKSWWRAARPRPRAMLCQQGNHQRQHTQPNPTRRATR